MFGTDIGIVARHDTRMGKPKRDYPAVFLKEWREAGGLTGAELGARLLPPRNKHFISNLETGKIKSGINTDLRRELEQALGLADGDMLAPPPSAPPPAAGVGEGPAAPYTPGEASMDAFDVQIEALIKRLGYDALIDRASRMEARRRRTHTARPLQRRKT